MTLPGTSATVGRGTGAGEPLTAPREQIALAQAPAGLAAAVRSLLSANGSTAWTQQSELTDSNGASGDSYGGALAVSGNGSIALVGAYGASVGGHSGQGEVYVLTNSGGSWNLQTTLTASDGAAGDGFGYAVAVDTTPATAIVGAYTKAVGPHPAQGMVYVFTRTGSTWTQQTELTASDGAANDRFGGSVSVNTSMFSGTTALISAPDKQVGGTADQGAAYVFSSANGVWSQQAELMASDGSSGAHFGCSLALTVIAPIEIALVGACGQTIAGNAAQGAAYVFLSSGGSWSQIAELTAGDGAPGDAFGDSVSLKVGGVLAGGILSLVDGAALVGAPGHHGAQGAAYVFTLNGGSWSQQVALTAADGVGNDSFGTSVALTGDSNGAVIGAPGATVGGKAHQGAAYAFSAYGGIWSLQGKLTAADGAAGDGFGGTIALYSQSTALIGAPDKTLGGNAGQGAAYVFSGPPPVATASPTATTIPSATPVPATATGTPTASATPVPATNTDTPTSAATPTETNTESPTGTPVPPLTVHGTSLTAVSGQSLTAVALGAFDDPVSHLVGDYTVTVDWGDGRSDSATVQQAGAPGSFSISGSHLYESAGLYPLNVTIAVNDGRSAYLRSIVQVTAAPGTQVPPLALVTGSRAAVTGLGSADSTRFPFSRPPSGQIRVVGAGYWLPHPTDGGTPCGALPAQIATNSCGVLTG